MRTFRFIALTLILVPVVLLGGWRMTRIRQRPASVEENGPSDLAQATSTPLVRTLTPVPATWPPPAEPTATPLASPTPQPTAAPLPTASPAPPWPPLRVNEVLYDPAPPGADAAFEWVELYNPSGQAVSLDGWTLADNQETDPLPALEVPPRGFLVIAATEEALAAFPDVAGVVGFVADGTLGNGLANNGDHLRLLAPDGTVVDALSWGNDRTALDPPCPDVPAGHSLERAPAGHDTDQATDFVDQPAPSPGEGILPTPVTATPIWSSMYSPGDVVINEVLYDPPPPGPESSQEWIELYNNTERPIALDGWRIGDNRDEDVLPPVTIAPHGFVIVAASPAFDQRYPGVQAPVVYPDDGTLGNGLANAGDRVILRTPDGTVIDAMSYGDDRSILDPACPRVAQGRSLERVPPGRDTDRAADFVVQIVPSPGQAGPPPPPTPSPTLPWPAPRPRTAPQAPGPARVSIAQAREMPLGRRVVVQGRVTAPPGVFGAHRMYVQDTTAGIKVYRAKGPLPPAAEGDLVEVAGVLGAFHGERELQVTDEGAVHRLAPGDPVLPLNVHTGQVGETLEGRLVTVTGAVVAFKPAMLLLDDGTGPVEVVFLKATGLKRPGVMRGQIWQVTGIVSQYTSSKGAGYRLLPRFAPDVHPAPALLPVTGGQLEPRTRQK